ncbi:unnamed protein product [Phytophthora lilii]|uniref:Unnamed protein product n=1 Tax=Phytophthora lilii TaxID=2077276 RepID=A0A9W6TXT9_9STRA|nr:unnamed protein product [Phytophthora lilii]
MISGRGFVEQYAAETFTSVELSTVPTHPPTPSPSDATPSEFFAMGSAGSNGALPVSASETLTTVSLPIPVTQQRHGTAQDHLTKKRKPAKPRKHQANPNRARNELRFELAYLREKAGQLEQELTLCSKSRN